MNDLNYHSGFKTSEQAKWCIAQVNRILNNEYYIGTVVQASLGIFNILR
ncbi:recombinase family protein [butyrate-producing bacterium]|nr:recombinase family protein [butyrate-producing bacterium]